MERRLYEASLTGNVSELRALMEEDDFLLDRLPLSSSDETPLHVAALRGHSEFAAELLRRTLRLAADLDWLGRSPLHLAAACGHLAVVRELLRANTDVCGVYDADGRTPLHLAAVNGRVEVMRELIRCCPESVRQKLGGGETVLHLCVKHNRLEALKALVESAIGEHDFINGGDRQGNTILHLAVALKQKETVSYLLQQEAIKAQAKTKNMRSLTPLDIIEMCPIRDAKSIEITDLLLQAVSRDVPRASQNHPRKGQIVKRIWQKYFKFEDHWLEDARGNLIMTATLSATVAFQAGVNPPSALWQEDNNQINPSHNTGESIMATSYPTYYKTFLTFNTASLLSSLAIILLMISGFPLKNRFSMWVLTIAMSASLTFMTLTYFASVLMLPPYPDFRTIIDIGQALFYGWISLCVLVVVLQTFSILSRERTKLWRKLKAHARAASCTREQP